MRKIKIRRIRDAFSRGASHLSQPSYEVPMYLTHRRAFNPTTVLIAIIVMCLLGGIFAGKRELFVIAFSLIALYVLVYNKTKRIIKGLKFRRTLSEKGNAGDEIQITLEIINTSPFAVTELLVTENFLGTLAEPEELYVGEISPYSTHRLVYKAKLDAGSGFFGFDPIKATLEDSLGLSQAELTDESQNQEVQVFPTVKKIPEIQIKASQNSIHYGLFDVQTPSVSVNFMGVRDYVRGDPLKHISWKISARNQNLVVKEFEKSVNVEVSVLLDMDQKKHAGVKSDSTWEAVKDLGLSLISQQLEKGNSVQVLSQNYFLPSGRGETQSSFAVFSIGQFKPVVSPAPLLQSSFPLYERSSVLFYVTPCFIHGFEEEIKFLKKLRTQGYEIYLFLIEPNSFFKKQVHSINKTLLLPNETALKDKADVKLIRELAKSQIHTYWIDRDRGISNSLLKERAAEFYS